MTPGFQLSILLALQVSVFCTVFGFGLDPRITDVRYLIRTLGRPRAVERVSASGDRGFNRLDEFSRRAFWRDGLALCPHESHAVHPVHSLATSSDRPEPSRRHRVKTRFSVDRLAFTVHT